ncbi:flagellar filament capping protein FliD [Massilia phyllostachyos]
MAISSAGVGSGLNVDDLISRLMAAESAPLAKYDTRTAAFQSKLDALSKLSSAVSSFQGSLSSLTSAATFKAVSASVSNPDILKGSATSEAAPGTYKISVSQLAQSQTLNSAGHASMTSSIGSGAKTTLTFQFGTTSGGRYGVDASALSAAVASTGIANGSLTINGTAITTSNTTRSAQALAAAINAETEDTGVTAVAQQTATSATMFGGAGAASFGAVTTAAGASYSLSVGGVRIAAQEGGIAAGAAGSVSAASIDDALSGNNATTQALSAAGITFTGSAANGDLQFFSAEGANITVSESVEGAVTGGLNNSGTANNGMTTTVTAGVSLSSSSGNAISVGGSKPALAGLTAGSNGSYIGAGFAQDGDKASGVVTLEAGDQSLQGIRDAINKANIGVQASIVSDGSAEPYRLVLTSTKTGEKSSMKISVSGEAGVDADPALQALLGYDPAGAQGLKQTSAAQSAKLDVNGVAVTSDTNNVSGAIQGVTLDVSQTGKSNVTIAKDTNAVKNSVDAFVKAYNTLNSTMKSLTAYDATTKKGGPLVGDSTVRSVQTQLRGLLGTAVGDGKLTTLSQVGITFQKDGSLAVDSSKLNKAMTENFSEISGLFAAVGKASDANIKFNNSTAKTQPGSYAVNITEMASKGNVTSKDALAATTTIAPNTSWLVTLNQTDPESAKRTATVKLNAGTYTPDQLASMIRAAINGTSNFMENGDTVETKLEDGKLSLSSTKWGSASNLTIENIAGGSTVEEVFGAEPKFNKGKDVAGTIGGAPATGNGQTLTAAAGSKAEGLKIDVTDGAAGERGTISFTQGYAYQLNNLATSFMGKEGLITNKADGLNVSIKAVDKERVRFTERLEQTEKRYRAQFTALDSMLASMQRTQSYLTQQLAAIAANS